MPRLPRYILYFGYHIENRLKKLDIKIKFVLLASISLMILGTTFQSQIFAEENVIPDWIRGVAGFWSEGKISDQEFLNAIEFLIKHGMIKVSTPLSPSVEDTQLKQETNSIIPKPELQVDDFFDKTNQNLLENSPTIMTITGKWSNGEISDKTYLEQHQKLINSGFIPTFEKTSREDNTHESIPNWIKNNAKWYAENNINNYDYYQGLIHLYKTGFLNNPQTESDDIKINPKDSIKPQDTNLQDKNSVINIQEKTKLLAKQLSDNKLTDNEYVKKLQEMIDSKQIGPFNVAQNDNIPSYEQDVYHTPTKYEIKYPFDGTKIIKIEKGDTIELINSDIISHTVTSGTKEYGYDGKFFDRSLSPNSHTSNTFLSAGTFEFYCKYGNQYWDDVLYTHGEEMIIEVIDTSPDVGIPLWVKDNARFWSNDHVYFDDYLKSVEWLIKNNYLNNPPDFIPNPPPEPKTPEQMVRENALQWANDEINDKLYLDNVAKFISNYTIGPPTYGSHEEIYNKTIPAWIKDNAMQYGLGKSNIEEYMTALNYLWRMGLLQV